MLPSPRDAGRSTRPCAGKLGGRRCREIGGVCVVCVVWVCVCVRANQVAPAAAVPSHLLSCRYRLQQ